MVDIPILRAASGPEALTAIVDAVKAEWSRHTWVPAPIRDQVEIAVAEIAANIVEHTGRFPAATVEMEMKVLNDRVEVTFTDTGDPADVDVDGAQMPDELAERGRGLAMARALLDRLSYTRSELGNQWTLVSRAFLESAERRTDSR